MSKDLTPLLDLFAELAQWSVDARKDAEMAQEVEIANGYEFEDTVIRISAQARADAYHQAFKALSTVLDGLFD